MRRGTQSRKWGRTVLPYIFIAVLVFFAAVPIYGIIRDAGRGEAVFVLDSPLSVSEPPGGVLGAFIDRMDWIFNPVPEINVPVVQRFDLEGRVAYTSGAPFANGSILLESTPRYTTTNPEGYFTFLDVEEGRHTISVLESGGTVLARRSVLIERAEGLEETSISRLDDGSFLIRLSVNIPLLQITILLEEGEDGMVSGVEDIFVGTFPDSSDQPDPSPPTEGETSPEDGEGDSDSGDNGDDEDIPGGGSPTDPSPVTGMDVYDTRVSYGTDGVASVNIFGDEKLIAPGMKGSYKFTVDNGKNSFTVGYNVVFTVSDSLPEENKIPMRYRLSANGSFVAGGRDKWVSLDALYHAASLQAGNSTTYTLDWYWTESDLDNDYAAFAGYPYSLKITVTT